MAVQVAVAAAYLLQSFGESSGDPGDLEGEVGAVASGQALDFGDAVLQ